jgi:hypothetical protein
MPDESSLIVRSEAAWGTRVSGASAAGQRSSNSRTIPMAASQWDAPSTGLEVFKGVADVETPVEKAVVLAEVFRRPWTRHRGGRSLCEGRWQ